MTVVVAVKISDGIVVASDSASSIFDQNSNIINIYNNANKIVNLCKTVPIGAMFCGAGSIGKLSISTIAKDYRIILADNIKDTRKLNVETVAKRFFEHLKSQHYDKAYPVGGATNPEMTVWVFGFSPKEDFPEIWNFSLGANHAPPKEALAKDSGGLAWGGELEIVQRIVMGYGTVLRSHLVAAGVDGAIVDAALDAQRHSQEVICDVMPVQDAIELAKFLVGATIEFSRFKMGAATVGGPIEIASITKHEGFKWINRKHYFSTSINQTDGG